MLEYFLRYSHSSPTILSQFPHHFSQVLYPSSKFSLQRTAGFYVFSTLCVSPLTSVTAGYMYIHT